MWRCKNCKSEHSASVKEGPFAYVADESGKKKRQKVLEIDNRGLEFVEFRADVSAVFPSVYAGVSLAFVTMIVMGAGLAGGLILMFVICIGNVASVE